LEPRLPVHIRVRVTHGRLSVMWDYDPFLCPPATLGRVAEEFRDVLLSYAACAAK
jgi:hypothetical protein